MTIDEANKLPLGTLIQWSRNISGVYRAKSGLWPK